MMNNLSIKFYDDEEFTTISDENFAVKASDDFSVETSDRKQITGIGFIKNTFENEIKLYPNATDGRLALVLSENNYLVSTDVKNNVCYEVLNKTFSNTNFIEIDIKNQAKGIYFLCIEPEGQTSIFKILKE